jgi:hypothetical protein
VLRILIPLYRTVPLIIPLNCWNSPSLSLSPRGSLLNGLSHVSSSSSSNFCARCRRRPTRLINSRSRRAENIGHYIKSRAAPGIWGNKFMRSINLAASPAATKCPSVLGIITHFQALSNFPSLLASSASFFGRACIFLNCKFLQSLQLDLFSFFLRINEFDFVGNAKPPTSGFDLVLYMAAPPAQRSWPTGLITGFTGVEISPLNLWEREREQTSICLIIYGVSPRLLLLLLLVLPAHVVEHTELITAAARPLHGSLYHYA